MYLVTVAVLTLIIIGLMLLSGEMKPRTEHRILQIRSVIFTIIFDIVVVRLFVLILDLLDGFIGIPFIRMLLFKIIPGANASAAFFGIITLLSCIFVSVVYCLALFAINKLWLNQLAKKSYLHKKNIITRFFNWIASFSYKIKENPEIKNLWVNIGHWLRIMRNIFSGILIAEAVFFGIYLQAGWTWINDLFLSSMMKSLYMIPVLTWILLNQVVLYLQADSSPDDIRLETEEDRLTHFGNYKKLVALYDNFFNGQALISYYINESVPEHGLFSGPTDEQKKRSENPELLEALCRSISNIVDPLPTNLIDALVDLINGNSIAIFDSVSGEFQLFYLAYLQKELALQRKALVVCDTEGQVEDVILQFRDIFEKLNKSHEVWQINDIRTLLTKQKTDILVCTEEQLLHSNVEEIFRDFSKNLFNIFVMHAYDIMCRQNAFSLRFFNSLKKKNAQFVFLVPENNRDIDSALEIRLNNSQICLYDNFNEKAGACILCWRAESFYKIQQALSMDLYHDFGIAYSIALIAMKNSVSEINIYAPESVPIKSYEATVQSYLSILANNYFFVDSISTESIVTLNPIVAFRKKDLSFDIIYDKYNNLLNVAKKAMSNCAELNSMVHIISRPYMLRDYFAHHLNMADHNEKGMQLIIPVFYQDLKAPSVALLVRLREKGMMIEEIIGYMEQFDITGENVEEVLRIAINAALGTRYTHIYSFFTFGDQEKSVFYDGEYHYTRFVRLSNEDIYRRVCLLTEKNIVISGAHNEILPISRSSVYNRFLPKQHHSFGEKRYEIISITNGEINVRSEETVERDVEYTQIYDIPLANLSDEPERSWDRNEFYRCDLFKIKIQRSIRGFFSHTNGLDFYEDNTHRYELDSVITEEKNTYCLRVKLSFPFNEKCDSAAAMMVLLMRGILETAIPKNFHDILVMTKLGEDAFDESLFDDTSVNALRKDPMPFDWLESDDNELPLSQSLKELFQAFGETNFEPNTETEINLYLVDFSENGSHILSGIAEDIARLFNVLYGYLDWVIKNPKLKHCYLRFGYHQIPAIFDLSSVYNCLQRISNYLPDVSGNLHGKFTSFELTENVHCSFCGRSIAVSSWKFDDERIMCEECYGHRTTERREIQVLLKRAYQTLENNYLIHVPDGIKIKFKSAESIRKASGTVNGGRVLGFYSFNNREIWIERGGPEPCVLSTLIHELTHAWQHANIDVDKLQLKHLEGHSTYVEIECSRLLGQSVYANFWEKVILSGNDEYSQGLKYWKDRMKVESDKNIFHHIQKL